MCYEIQAEDETRSKKSGSITIKSRSRVKSVSKYDEFICITHFLLAIKSQLSVKSGWRLDILFTLDLLLLWLKLTFYFTSYPLLEFHGTYSVNFLLFFGQLSTECHGGNLHADKDGDQVQHNPEHHGNNLHVEEGKDQIKLHPERHDDHSQGG